MGDESQDELPPPKRAKMDDKQNSNDEGTSSEVTSTKADGSGEGPPVIDFSDDKYNDFVTPEELDKLREFKILDEVKSNDEESNDEDAESSDGIEGLPEEEIEKMLEEDLPEGFKGVPKPKEKPYVTRHKTVLEEKVSSHWEVLPLDWMMVRHYSGMPVYMHRTSRVCTLAKPYFLGKGNTRRHDIPISSIPCLVYRRALEEEKKQQDIDKEIQEQIKNGTWVNNVGHSEKKDGHKVTEKNYANTVSKDCVKNTGHKDGNTISEVKVNEVDKDKDIIKVIDLEDNEGNTSQKVNAKTDKIIENNEAIDENKKSSPSLERISPSECPFKHMLHVAEDKKEKDAELITCPFSGKSLKSPNNNKTIANEMVADEMKFYKSKVDESKANEMIVDETKDDEMKISKAKAEEIKTNEMEADETKCSEPQKAEAGNKDTNVTPEIIPLNRQPVVLPGGIVMPPPKVETVNTSWKTQHLTPEEVNAYCRSLFKFKTVTIMHFNRWADRRKYTKARKTLQYPTLPKDTRLITIPAQPAVEGDAGDKTTKRDWVMNMNGRSYLSVFHEYVRRALQKQPMYEFVQLENATTPYQATVYIGGMAYGVGLGSSKRQAKAAAARASIHVLIPEMKDELEPELAPGRPQPEPDFTFFDYVGIEDPRITEFCAATCEPSPHAILRTCLLRNFGAGDRHIQTEMKKLEFQKIELTMKVGKHTATVVCKNKKTAKQRASQSILQALHPHVRSWGSLLRLYGSRSVKSCKEKKLEEQQITLLQDKARHNEPNYAVLEKLRAEMSKLRERDAAVVGIGTLLLPTAPPATSGAALNNVDL